jgi:hypothetical protein
MRHDGLRDLLAHEMREVLHDVQCEPPLQPVTGESLFPKSANTADDARADIRAKSFWRNQQNAYFDLRVFYPHASSYSSRSLSELYSTFERAKKRGYNDRILQIEQGSFTPLVFSSTGGMGPETTVAVKALATLLAEKRKERYSHTMGLLRCRIAFSLMRAATTCLRGTRCRRVHVQSDTPADLVINESRIPL